MNKWVQKSLDSQQVKFKADLVVTNRGSLIYQHACNFTHSRTISGRPVETYEPIFIYI